jgi:hypothetical protein
MARNYKPRRCSKRWLDGDCPAGVLAIIDHGDKELGRFDVIYTDVQEVRYPDSPRVEQWMMLLSVGANGGLWCHPEMQAHEVAAYRYRMKHRYTRWSDLPETVKAAVRRDLEP